MERAADSWNFNLTSLAEGRLIFQILIPIKGHTDTSSISVFQYTPQSYLLDLCAGNRIINNENRLAVNCVLHGPGHEMCSL